MPVAVLKVSSKDAEILGIFTTLRQLDETISSRLEPLMKLRDILMDATGKVVFGDSKEDARHEIVLDPNHSLIFTMKDGKFDYAQTCNCEHEHPDEVREVQTHGVEIINVG